MSHTAIIPRTQLLGFILGELAVLGPRTANELHEHLEANHSRSLDPGDLSLGEIRVALRALESQGCARLTTRGYAFVRWPLDGGFGTFPKSLPEEGIKQPEVLPEVKPALTPKSEEGRPTKLKQASFF